VEHTAEKDVRLEVKLSDPETTVDGKQVDPPLLAYDGVVPGDSGRRRWRCRAGAVADPLDRWTRDLHDRIARELAGVHDLRHTYARPRLNHTLSAPRHGRGGHVV
jgi:hypothetical protein